jgi:hypothetical protein
MEIIRVGVDLAKNVFQLHGVDELEKPVWKRSLRRGHWLRREERLGWRRAQERTTGVGGYKGSGSSEAESAASCEA